MKKQIEEQIIRTEYSEVMQKSFIDYAMSVIVDRALPDARDGLKPVQRRTLYSMYELGVKYDKPYRKSARIVGDTMGKYHPHGDSSIYEAMVVMAQGFKKGLPLVDGHGNFGSIEGDGAAAMRYTEARLAKVTQMAFLGDLDKDMVDFKPNFDGMEKEPVVLPVRVPNLLLNGAEGIAVGMTTSIPPHNITEVLEAVKAYIKNPDIEVAELMQYIKGPDFPTGGIVVNEDELLEIYTTGVGKIKIRGKIEEEDLKGGKKQLVITEIPYPMIGLNIGKFLNDVYALVENKKTNDIVDISNQSSKEGIRIVIELKKGADVEYIKNLLYKKTRLEDTFGVNMVAVVDGRPETMSLSDIIRHHVNFQYEINTRKYKTLLDKELDKKEIQEGLIKACDVIDLIIEILRGSKNVNDAKACLTKGDTSNVTFKSKESEMKAAFLAFTERQATAILDMRLVKLIGLEMEALIKEHEETLKNIAEYEKILGSRLYMAKVIMKEIDGYIKEYGRERRTSIENAEEIVIEEKKIEEQEVVFLMDRFGYCKTIDLATYERNQEAVHEENKVVIHCMNTGRLSIFTDTGNLHMVKVLDVPFGRFRDKGTPIDNISNYTSAKEEMILVESKLNLGGKDVFMASSDGMCKIVEGDEFDVAKKTTAATKLNLKAKLMNVTIVDGTESIIIETDKGYFLRFPISEIPKKKKTAVGVRGIKLGKDDKIVAIHVLKEGEEKNISRKGGEIALHRIHPAHRDGKGTKK